MSILALFLIVSVNFPMEDFGISSSIASLFTSEDISVNLVEGVCSTVESVKSLPLNPELLFSCWSLSLTSLGEPLSKDSLLMFSFLNELNGDSFPNCEEKGEA